MFINSVLCWLSLFLFVLALILYKKVLEKYFVRIYAMNAVEGMFITIYTILFYYLYIKKEKEKPFEFKIYYLIPSCIMQVVINLMIKFIVYFYDEIGSTVPYYLQVFVDTLKKIVTDIYDKKFSNIPLYLLLLLTNLYLIFFILVYCEIIILKVFGLELKTKKYLEKNQMNEIYELPDTVKF
jgi:hypothetical protein